MIVVVMIPIMIVIAVRAVMMIMMMPPTVMVMVIIAVICAGSPRMTEIGQSLPGRASSKSGHVRCASKAEVHSELDASAVGICGRDALDAKSSQRTIEGGKVPFQKT
jgi:hypothetical protein